VDIRGRSGSSLPIYISASAERNASLPVPELTRCADIKLNNGVSLQRRPERHVISHRTISP
jgi:hypothetical protein